jgi:hypothetical protein
MSRVIRFLSLLVGIEWRFWSALFRLFGHRTIELYAFIALQHLLTRLSPTGAPVSNLLHVVLPSLYLTGLSGSSEDHEVIFI